jgi:peptidoglycan hydrolase-like protein with peptidoglycan-binding domain
MSRRTLLYTIGVAFLLNAAPVVSAASSAGVAQTSSTTAKKKKTSAKSRRKPKLKGQTAPTPDRIKEIQSALQKDGSYEGTPTGKWDAATIDAMKKYQDKNGISPTGKIDAVSLNKLGLGSSTAGKGAPIPSTTPASSPSSSSSSSTLTSPADPPEK